MGAAPGCEEPFAVPGESHRNGGPHGAGRRLRIAAGRRDGIGGAVEHRRVAVEALRTVVGAGAVGRVHGHRASDGVEADMDAACEVRAGALRSGGNAANNGREKGTPESSPYPRSLPIRHEPLLSAAEVVWQLPNSHRLDVFAYSRTA